MFDLKRFRKENKLKQSDVADRIGVAQARISNYERGKDVSDHITHLLDIHFDMEPFRVKSTLSFDDPDAITVRPNILHVPLAAEAGFLGGAIDPLFNTDLVPYFLPDFRGEGFSFVVKGESMMDTLRPGEILAVERKPVTGYNEIINDYLYAVATENEILVKRVNKHKNKSKLWLESDNEDYKEIEFDLTPHTRLYKGRRTIGYNLTRKLRYEN